MQTTCQGIKKIIHMISGVYGFGDFEGYGNCDNNCHNVTKNCHNPLKEDTFQFYIFLFYASYVDILLNYYVCIFLLL